MSGAEGTSRFARLRARRFALLLAAVVLAGAALRVYQLRDLPAGLFCDEAALGYNAWAISHFGIDENGVRFPLFVWSFGGYKNPVYVYGAMLPIGVLGLDEFSLRLTSALFGTGTIIGLFFLGRAVIGPWAGIWAAALLAICPWHLHFSRIAFELISFPFLFVIGLVFLIRFTQGRRTLPLAFFFLGGCLYAYAVAKLFVPLFLIGFGLLYLPTVWRRWREWLIAVPVLLLTVAPVVQFDLAHQRGSRYFENTSILRADAPPEELARQFGKNYAEFFSPDFLLERGDRIVRHAVRGHGELYRFFVPLLALGGVVLLFRRDRAGLLILWWLALYPAGASLMNEIPSASRGFIGAAAFCLVAGVGIAAALRVLGWIGHWRPLALALQLAGVAALGWVAHPEVSRYLHLYFVEYPKYSAPTYGGFQYGYREAVQYMESQRANYDLLMMTATEVNQPYIFALFYARMDPREFRRTLYPGYLILDPAEYRRYSVDQRVLYAMRESDLTYFSDYDVHKTIVAPGGQVEFVIAEARKRKLFITNWLALGLFDNRGGAGVHRDFIDIAEISRRRYEGKYGETYWRPMSPQFIRVDFNAFFATQDREHPMNPEEVCAYALATADVPAARAAVLEIGGSGDLGVAWLNGRSLTPVPQRFGPDTKRRPIELRSGLNALLIKSCEGVGSWYFTARVTDPDGKDVPDVVFRAEIPDAEQPLPPVPPPPAGDLQVVEGFREVLRFRHTQDTYPDYRGGTRSWWTYQRDNEAEVAWLTAPPPAKRPTVVAFTASMGEQAGDSELWVNGQYVLSFDTGVDYTTRHWERGAYRLIFSGKQIIAGNSGIFVLVVPPEAVTPGTPLELRVIPARGDGNAWFMIKDYADTAAVEHITPELVAEMQHPTWEE